LVGGAEVHRAQPAVERKLVAGVAEVADDEIVFGEAAVEEGFEPAVVLHAVGEGVADDADMIARLQFERGGVEWRDGNKSEERKGYRLHARRLPGRTAEDIRRGARRCRVRGGTARPVWLLYKVRRTSRGWDRAGWVHHHSRRIEVRRRCNRKMP